MMKTSPRYVNALFVVLVLLKGWENELGEINAQHSQSVKFVHWINICRLIPRLPPKKIIVSEDAHFLEARRKGLLRWLSLMARHPVVSRDALVSYFLRDQGHDVQHKIRELFRRAPDEFTTSELASRAKVSERRLPRVQSSATKSSIVLLEEFQCCQLIALNRLKPVWLWHHQSGYGVGLREK